MSGSSTIVRARRQHRCTGKYEGCAVYIQPGDLYVRHVEFPGEWVDDITVYKGCVQCSISAGWDLYLWLPVVCAK